MNSTESEGRLEVVKVLTDSIRFLLIRLIDLQSQGNTPVLLECSEEIVQACFGRGRIDCVKKKQEEKSAAWSEIDLDRLMRVNLFPSK
jgi:hypothetical protein